MSSQAVLGELDHSTEFICFPTPFFNGRLKNIIDPDLVAGLSDLNMQEQEVQVAPHASYSLCTTVFFELQFLYVLPEGSMYRDGVFLSCKLCQTYQGTSVYELSSPYAYFALYTGLRPTS